MQAAEAKTLAKALEMPKIDEVSLVGVKTWKSTYTMLKTAADPNLLTRMHIKTSYGELLYHTNNNIMDPMAAKALISIWLILAPSLL